MARIDLGKVVGDSATISVGNVTTLEAGENATVVNTGTELNGVFDFGIPKGPKGDKGDTGSQGPVGPQGVQGKAFTIDKTYNSVLDMQADFNNMEVGSYVMIASNVESEDNARLYYRDTNEWKFISDFSGATGIQGEQGPQGQAGYTPVKGVDYFTSADIAEIEGDIKEITGDLANLDTTDKSNLVSAINEIVGSSSGGGMSIYEVESTTENKPFIIENKPAGIYIFKKDPTTPNAIHLKAFSDTRVEYFFAGNGVLILTDTSLDKSESDWKSVGRFYGSVYDDHFANGNYYVTGMKVIKIWQPTGGFNTYDFAVNNNVGYKFINPEATAKITQKHTYNVLPESTVVPTNNNQFANKKYVDDSIATAITTTLGGSY